MKNLLKRLFYSPFLAKKISRLLAQLHRLSYLYAGQFASVAEGGLHPKHRLIQYHKFFTGHVFQGDRVLEVGCGNGALLRDVAVKSGGSVVGVEISGENAASAKTRMEGLGDVVIVHGDIWEYDDLGRFDVVILSNTLEHLDRRPELLRRIMKKFRPQKFLIRVPMFEREWLVPYKKELGIEWRLDLTHEIEFTEDEFKKELSEAGLEIASLEIRWGEFYAVAVPKK